MRKLTKPLSKTIRRETGQNNFITNSVTIFLSGQSVLHVG